MSTLATDIIRYRSPQLLTRLLSRSTLSRLRQSLLILTLLSCAGAVVDSAGFSGTYFFPLSGATLIFFSLWVEQMLLYSYHNSFYFHGLNSILGLKGKPTAGATYEIAEAVFKNSGDLTKAFCDHNLGQEIIVRAGITQEVLSTYLASARTLITAESVVLPTAGVYSLVQLAEHLVKHDAGFKSVLAKSAVTDSMFLATVRWVVINHHQLKQKQRWWGRDILSKSKSLGGDWAYGATYLLNRYTKDLKLGMVFSSPTIPQQFADNYITEIETALSLPKSGNVLIIGEAGTGIMDLLIHLDKRLENGESLGAINGYDLRLLDTVSIFANSSDKHTLEQRLLALLSEASKAGNIILVIENVSTFIKEGREAGIFVPELFDPFLASSDLHIIATDSPGSFHNQLEQLGGFTHRFTEVVVEASGHESTLRVVEASALASEQRLPILFTYPALEAIVTGAERYLVEGVMPEKATKLLIDIGARAASEKVAVITSDFVYSVISERTGIPAGPIDTTERNLLLNLETELHRRVIGQDEAIKAIASTMRRARAGVQTSERPIGSFLFFGPTGVGKTETAKALALVFFGSEVNMHRFDMSEFSDPGSLQRLLGNNDASGVLSDSLHEKPYSVLLLDEFEKAHRSVHDLFLQILDEGTFTDGRGNVINARNTIIIATSNAGSDLIMRTVEQRQALSTLTGEIINHIITQGIFRPELINRFDNTVIYEPLAKDAQTEVATLFLRELAERLQVQGYTLSITPELIAVVAVAGYNLQFGARPMRRAVQDIVEEAIAKKIIAGVIKPGDTITLTPADLTRD